MARPAGPRRSTNTGLADAGGDDLASVSGAPANGLDAPGPIAQGESAKYVCDRMGHSSIQVDERPPKPSARSRSSRACCRSEPNFRTQPDYPKRPPDLRSNSCTRSNSRVINKEIFGTAYSEDLPLRHNSAPEVFSRVDRSVQSASRPSSKRAIPREMGRCLRSGAASPKPWRGSSRRYAPPAAQHRGQPGRCRSAADERSSVRRRTASPATGRASPRYAEWQTAP